MAEAWSALAACASAPGRLPEGQLTASRSWTRMQPVRSGETSEAGPDQTRTEELNRAGKKDNLLTFRTTFLLFPSLTPPTRGQAE